METWVWVAGGVALALLLPKVLAKFRADAVSGPEAHKLVDEGAVLIDVRSPAEFKSGSIPKAKNIPLPDLPSRLNAVGPKDKMVIVFCASGMRSASAASLLKKAGYTQVRNLGSVRNW